MQVRKGDDGSYFYSVPFYFVVPFGTEYPNTDRPLQCRILPPSLEEERLYTDPLSIKYSLHAIVDYRLEDDEVSVAAARTGRAEQTQVIDFLPFSDVEPPTHVADYPGEFVLSANSPVWRHVFGGRVGSLIMTTREPLPLAFSPIELNPSTSILMSLTVAPANVFHRLRNMTVKVKPAIRVKTFYSVEPMPCVPRQAFLAHSDTVRLRDDIIKLDHEEYKNFDWAFCSGAQRTDPPIYQELAEAVTAKGTSAHSKSISHVSDAWTTSFRIPIRPLVTLPPTFCGKLISRSYSLLLRIRTGAVRSQMVDFEIPLQVVHLQPFQSTTGAVQDEESAACIGLDGILARAKV